MAITTKKDRYTMIGISQVVYSTFLPDGSVDTQDRKALLRIFRLAVSVASGILKLCFSSKRPQLTMTAKNGAC